MVFVIARICKWTAIGYAKFYSWSHHAVIRVYDAAGNVIEALEHAGAAKTLANELAA